MQLNLKLGIAESLDKLGLLAALKRYRASRSGLVLAFHRVLENSDFDLCYEPYIAMSASVFEDLLKLLCREFWPVSLEQLIKQPEGESGRQRVAITFDDGWEDTFSVAYPLLLRYEIPATVFLCTGLMNDDRHMLPEERFARIWNYCEERGQLRQLQEDLCKWGVSSSSRSRSAWAIRLKRLPLDAKLMMLSHLEEAYRSPHLIARRFMTWNDARTMQRGGVRFGSHTVRHSTLKIEQQSTILKELSESRRMINEQLGEEADYLAYPNGAFDERVMELTKAAGFSHAFTTEPGFVRRKTNPMAIPRISISDSVVTGEHVTLHSPRTRLYLQQVSTDLVSRPWWNRSSDARYRPA
jgi:peptidoglycan/xylan/chitin deacetylase (PgdA/CDA1 family)